MKKLIPFALSVAALSACENMVPAHSQTPGAPPQSTLKTDLPAPSPDAVTAEQFDTTSAQDRAAATAPAGPLDQELGRTVASLGNPANPGFWLETPLVSETMQGHVVYGPTGVSVAVTLIPIEGPVTAGSRISLAAMRLLNTPLAGLLELMVYKG